MSTDTTPAPYPWHTPKGPDRVQNRSWSALTHHSTIVFEQPAFEPPHGAHIREFGLRPSDINYPPDTRRPVVEYLPGHSVPVPVYEALATEGPLLYATANTFALTLRRAWSCYNRTRKRTLFGRKASL